ncbi:MAG TPA: hypothetical protein VFT00_04620 [Nocardioides sp.]|nr:hypothetical protein [Nocardioides sp.]
MSARRVAVAVAAVLVALLAWATWTGRAGGPPTIDPSGVDGLAVPTPSADPADFVAAVDNPWFPLEPGTVRTYRVLDVGGTRTETVTVTGDTRVVQGVTTIVVHDVITGMGGRVVQDSHDWYAQDVAGNVWHFGEAGTRSSWEAGVDGAEAGLAMPATPRVGDGFRQEYAAGAAEGVTEVLSLVERRSVPAGVFGDLVQTEETTPLDPGSVQRRYYAEGLGLVYVESVAGDSGIVELVDVTPAGEPAH